MRTPTASVNAALHRAARAGNAAGVLLALDEGADTDAFDDAGRTALEHVVHTPPEAGGMVAERQRAEVVRVLFARGPQRRDPGVLVDILVAAGGCRHAPDAARAAADGGTTTTADEAAAGETNGKNGPYLDVLLAEQLAVDAATRVGMITNHEQVMREHLLNDPSPEAYQAYLRECQGYDTVPQSEAHSQDGDAVGVSDPLPATPPPPLPPVATTEDGGVDAHAQLRDANTRLAAGLRDLWAAQAWAVDDPTLLAMLVWDPECLYTIISDAVGGSPPRGSEHADDASAPPVSLPIDAWEVYLRKTAAAAADAAGAWKASPLLGDATASPGGRTRGNTLSDDTVEDVLRTAEYLACSLVDSGRDSVLHEGVCTLLEAKLGPRVDVRGRLSRLPLRRADSDVCEFADNSVVWHLCARKLWRETDALDDELGGGVLGSMAVERLAELMRQYASRDPSGFEARVVPAYQIFASTAVHATAANAAALLRAWGVSVEADLGAAADPTTTQTAHDHSKAAADAPSWVTPCSRSANRNAFDGLSPDPDTDTVAADAFCAYYNALDHFGVPVDGLVMCKQVCKDAAWVTFNEFCTIMYRHHSL